MYLFLPLKGPQSFVLWSVLYRFHWLNQCCHSLSLIVVTCCITRCHLLYHLMSLVVIRCHSLYYSLSLVVTRCTIVCLFIKDLSEVWKNINNFIPLLIRKGSTNRWSQTASIIKSLMPFSFIFTMPNSFKNEIYSEKVLINNFSFLILFNFKSSFTFSFRNVFWLPVSNSIRNVDFFVSFNLLTQVLAVCDKKLCFSSCWHLPL